jgi:hypothetical protein
LFGSSLLVPDSSGWTLLGSHDFNRDGNPDLVWHNANGWMAYWYLDGTTLLGSSGLSSGSLEIPDSSGWRIIPRR